MVESSKFLFIADDPCLDFLNTEIARDGQAVDLLENFSDLIDWLQQSSLNFPGLPDSTLRRWENEGDGNDTLARARVLRKVIREMIHDRMERKRVSDSCIHRINEVLRLSKGHSVLKKTDSGFQQIYRREVENPMDVLVPVAESAAHLMAHGDFSLVRKCHNSKCVLLFYDRSKNHHRSWCSMSACGNRNKVAAYYERRRKKKRRPARHGGQPTK